MKSRTCTGCGKTKKVSHFYWNKAKKVFASRCKECMVKYEHKKYVIENKTKIRDTFLPEFKPEIRNYEGSPSDYIRFLENSVKQAVLR
jgi:hypothetical protein